MNYNPAGNSQDLRTEGDPPLTASGDSKTSRQLIDIRPFLGRSAQSVYERLEERRAALADHLKRELENRGFNGLVVESSPRAMSCWVKVVCWTPQDRQGGVHLRRTVVIEMVAHEHRRFQTEFTLRLSGQGVERVIPCVSDLDEAAVILLVRFLTEAIRFPRKSAFRRYRPVAASLWEWITLPKNRAVGLDRQLLAGLRRFWLAWVLVGVALAFIVHFSLILVSLAGIIVRLAYPIVFERRAVRPMGEPRNPLRYDSWQTVIPDLGKDASVLREAVVTDLRAGRHDDAWIETERVWNWGLDAVVEREQVVLYFRRSLVFIEIHAYGDDLYVDWEAYLNFGVWLEKPSHSGFESGGKSPVVIYDLKAGVQALQEYDYSDCNFALEWVHATVKRHLKRLLAEHKIDEDIDFTIIRESRSGARSASPDEEAAKPHGKSRFRILGKGGNGNG